MARKISDQLNQEWSGAKDGKAPPKPFEKIFANQYVIVLTAKKLRVLAGAVVGFLVGALLAKLFPLIFVIAAFVIVVAVTTHTAWAFYKLKVEGKKLDKEYEVEVKAVIAPPGAKVG